MKQIINCALIHTFAAISGIEDSAARITLSMDVTYAHGEFIAEVEKAKGCCEACYDDALEALYEALNDRLGKVYKDIEQVEKNARIGLVWWAFTSHDKNN